MSVLNIPVTGPYAAVTGLCVVVCGISELVLTELDILERQKTKRTAGKTKVTASSLQDGRSPEAGSPLNGLWLECFIGPLGPPLSYWPCSDTCFVSSCHFLCTVSSGNKKPPIFRKAAVVSLVCCAPHTPLSPGFPDRLHWVYQ